MSFQLTRIAFKSRCDKCKQEIAPDADGIEIYTGGKYRDDRSIIHVHAPCLTLALKALDRRVAREVPQRAPAPRETFDALRASSPTPEPEQ